MTQPNRIILNRHERHCWIWRRAKRYPLAGHSPLYCWITPASMRRLNALLDSGALADFKIIIEQPPAPEPVRYLWSEWVGSTSSPTAVPGLRQAQTPLSAAEPVEAVEGKVPA